MKLFLTSQWLLPEFRTTFAELFGGPLCAIRIVLIENGADDEVGDPKWVQNARQSLVDAGIEIVRLDLRKYTNRKNHDQLQTIFEQCDAVWVGGGNTFYLNWILKDSGASDVIIKRVAEGMVYGGGSAGAIVSGPTVQGFEGADDVSFAPKIVPDGLCLIDIVVIPHWGRGDYGPVMKKIADDLGSKGYRLQTLTDRQAFIVSGNRQFVIPDESQT